MFDEYYKSEHTATIVEVEDFGVINLNDLPIRVRADEKGLYQISWTNTSNDGKKDCVLTESGGRSHMDFGGRSLKVLRELE